MWQVVDKIGRAGGRPQRARKQQEWDQKYGKGKWEVVYVYNGKVYTRDQALEDFYHRSYLEFMQKNPGVVEELCQMAAELYNPHAEATTGVDLQVPAVLGALEKLGAKLRGTQRVAIGTWGTREGRTYPRISWTLNPFQVPLWCELNTSVEKFWQDFKHLAIKA